MTLEELLAANGIKLKSTAPGRHYTTCPQCSADRSTRPHQMAPVLGVTIESDGRVRWGCNHCDWTGPTRSDGTAPLRRVTAPPIQPGDDDGIIEIIDWDHPEAEFPYEDENGSVIYRNVRYPLLNPDGTALMAAKGKPDKTFRQQRREGRGWGKNLGGVKQVPYHPPELIAAIKSGRQVVFAAEGEAKADRLRALGFIATSMANKAVALAHAELFRGVEVALLPDNDEKGTARANEIGSALIGVAKSIRIVKLPRLQSSGEDVIEWLDKYMGSAEELDELYQGSPNWRPPSNGGAASNGTSPFDEAFFAEIPDDAIGQGADGMLRQEPESASNGAAGLKIRFFDDLDKPTPKPWEIKGVFARGETSAWIGPPGGGKSTLLTDITFHKAANIDWRGYKTRGAGRRRLFRSGTWHPGRAPVACL
jgi:AAA domain